MAADFLYGAKMLCDLSSAAGLLDMMSLDLSTGALPDIFSDPTGVPLVLAILTRIAAYGSIQNGRWNQQRHLGRSRDCQSVRGVQPANHDCGQPDRVEGLRAQHVCNRHCCQLGTQQCEREHLLGAEKVETAEEQRCKARL